MAHGRLDEGSPDAQKLALSPLSSKAYSQRGSILSLMGRYDHSIADHTEAIRAHSYTHSDYFITPVSDLAIARRACKSDCGFIRVPPMRTLARCGFPFPWERVGEPIGQHENAFADYEEAIPSIPTTEGATIAEVVVSSKPMRSIGRSRISRRPSA